MIRSAALIATSVPDPTARPRSALTKAGPSLTPSPTMATDRPSALEASDHRDLVRRKGTGHHIGHTDLSAHGPGGWLVVSGQQDAVEAERLEPMDGRRGGGSDGVGDRDGSDDGFVSPDEHGRSTERFPFGASVDHILGNRSRRRWRRGRPSRPRSRCPSTVPRAPTPALGTEPVDNGQAAQFRLGGGGNGSGDEVLGRLFERPRPTQERRAFDPGHPPRP